jgi:hypothetical protein
MSKGPIGIKDFNGRKYYHLELKNKDWCTYHKECPMDDNIPGNYCHVCKYQRKLDIPTLLAERRPSA